MANALESLVRKVSKELRGAQAGTLFKVPEEMQQTPCDFFGYDVNGRAILLECKMVKGKRLPCPGKGGLMPHQLRALMEAHVAGCHSIVLWQRERELAVLTWDVVEQLRQGRKSISWPDLPPLSVVSVEDEEIVRWKLIHAIRP